MTILACIPVEIQGSPTLAEVSAASLTTAEQTFALKNGTQLIFEKSDGDNIVEITEDVVNFYVPTTITISGQELIRVVDAQGDPGGSGSNYAVEYAIGNSRNDNHKTYLAWLGNGDYQFEIGIDVDGVGADNFYFYSDQTNKVIMYFVPASGGSTGYQFPAPDPIAEWDVAQVDESGARPVLALSQSDLSEEFVNFVGTVSVGNPIEAVGAKTLTTTHFVRVAINGTFRYMPVGTIA